MACFGDSEIKGVSLCIEIVSPMEHYNDQELYQRFRFRRADINRIVYILKDDLQYGNRRGSLSPEMQVHMTLELSIGLGLGSAAQMIEIDPIIMLG